jgi:hypothetical protein
LKFSARALIDALNALAQRDPAAFPAVARRAAAVLQKCPSFAAIGAKLAALADRES